MNMPMHEMYKHNGYTTPGNILTQAIRQH